MNGREPRQYLDRKDGGVGVGMGPGLLGGGPPPVPALEVLALERTVSADQANAIQDIKIILPDDPIEGGYSASCSVVVPAGGGSRRFVLICFYIWVQREFGRSSVSHWVATPGGPQWQIVVPGAKAKDDEKFAALMDRANWQCSHCAGCQNFTGGEPFFEPLLRNYVLFCPRCGRLNIRRLSLFPAPLQAVCIKLLPILPNPPPTIAPISRQQHHQQPPQPARVPIIRRHPITPTAPVDVATSSAPAMPGSITLGGVDGWWRPGTPRIGEPSDDPVKGRKEPLNGSTNGAVGDETWSNAQRTRLDAFYKTFAFRDSAADDNKELKGREGMETKRPTFSQTLGGYSSWPYAGGGSTNGNHLSWSNWGECKTRPPPIDRGWRRLLATAPLSKQSMIGPQIRSLTLSEQSQVTGCSHGVPSPDSLSKYLVYDNALGTFSVQNAVPKQQLLLPRESITQLAAESNVSPVHWMRINAVRRFTVRLAECGDCVGTCEHFACSKTMSCPPPLARWHKPIVPHVTPPSTTDATMTDPKEAKPNYSFQESKRTGFLWFWKDLQNDFAKIRKQYSPNTTTTTVTTTTTTATAITSAGANQIPPELVTNAGPTFSDDIRASGNASVDRRASVTDESLTDSKPISALNSEARPTPSNSASAPATPNPAAASTTLNSATGPATTPAAATPGEAVAMGAATARVSTTDGTAGGRENAATDTMVHVMPAETYHANTAIKASGRQPIVGVESDAQPGLESGGVPCIASQNETQNETQNADAPLVDAQNGMASSAASSGGGIEDRLSGAVWHARCVWWSAMRGSVWNQRQRTYLTMSGFLSAVQKDAEVETVEVGEGRALVNSLVRLLMPAISLIQETTMSSWSHRIWSLQTLIDFMIQNGRGYRLMIGRFLRILSLRGIVLQSHVDDWEEWDTLSNKWRSVEYRSQAAAWMRQQMRPPNRAMCTKFSPHIFPLEPGAPNMIEWAAMPAHLPPEFDYDPDDPANLVPDPARASDLQGTEAHGVQLNQQPQQEKQIGTGNCGRKRRSGDHLDLKHSKYEDGDDDERGVCAKRSRLSDMPSLSRTPSNFLPIRPPPYSDGGTAASSLRDGPTEVEHLRDLLNKDEEAERLQRKERKYGDARGQEAHHSQARALYDSNDEKGSDSDSASSGSGSDSDGYDGPGGPGSHDDEGSNTDPNADSEEEFKHRMRAKRRRLRRLQRDQDERNGDSDNTETENDDDQDEAGMSPLSRQLLQKRLANLERRNQSYRSQHEPTKNYPHRDPSKVDPSDPSQGDQSNEEDESPRSRKRRKPSTPPD